MRANLTAKFSISALLYVNSVLYDFCVLGFNVFYPCRFTFFIQSFSCSTWGSVPTRFYSHFYRVPGGLCRPGFATCFPHRRGDRRFAPTLTPTGSGRLRSFWRLCFDWQSLHLWSSVWSPNLIPAWIIEFKKSFGSLSHLRTALRVKGIHFRVGYLRMGRPVQYFRDEVQLQHLHLMILFDRRSADTVYLGRPIYFAYTFTVRLNVNTEVFIRAVRIHIRNCGASELDGRVHRHIISMVTCPLLEGFTTRPKGMSLFSRFTKRSCSSFELFANKTKSSANARLFSEPSP